MRAGNGQQPLTCTLPAATDRRRPIACWRSTGIIGAESAEGRSLVEGGASTSAVTDRLAPSVLVIMGVSGSGKSTVGALLAARLGWEFEDGDWFHPPANVEKMHKGTPLTDEDRVPWLNAI